MRRDTPQVSGGAGVISAVRRQPQGDRLRNWRVLVLAAALTAAGSPPLVPSAAAQFLAVLTDGRVLPVRGATLRDPRTVRLELEGEGWLEIPAGRLEAVVEALVEPEAESLPEQGCSTAWEDQALPEGVPFAQEIQDAAREAGLHPWLVAAVVEAESRFDPWAVSRVGARGLMQLMPSVWIPAALANPHEVRGNLRVGSAYLRHLSDRFGELPLALAAYNAGPTTVERFGGVPPYRETRAYLRRILSRFCPGEESGGL